MLLSVFATLALIAAAGAEHWANPVVIEPEAKAFLVGEVMDVKWSNSTTGDVNIDAVPCEEGVMDFPHPIAHGVPAAAGHFLWEIPNELRSACYRIHVWGAQTPDKEEGRLGESTQFTVLNLDKFAPTSFVVTPPNDGKPVEAGKEMTIKWNFSRAYNHPAYVNVGLYREGQDEPVVNIGQYASDLKAATWTVPENLDMGKKYYIGVGGNANNNLGPGQTSDMGGTSFEFTLEKAPAIVHTGEKAQEQKEKQEKAKRDSLAKRKENEKLAKGGKLKGAKISSSSVAAAGISLGVVALASIFLQL